MPLSHYPHGFRNGISIRGIPITMTHPGEVFWVNNSSVLAEDGVAGSDSSQNGTYQRPFASIDFAVGQCTANRGDIIAVMPGHSETVSAAGGIALDVAGVAVVGLGAGEDRPKVTFDTDVGADMDVGAANVSLVNLVFVNGIDNLTAPIDVNAADFSFVDCETRDNDSNFHCDDFILTDDNADRLYIEGWVHRANGGNSGAQTAISIVGGDDHVIMPKWIDGDFATACIENTDTACDNLQVFGQANFPSYLRNRNSADVIFTAVGTTKGRVGPLLNARLADDAANITEAFVGDDMEFFQPINIVNADGESSMETNITQSADSA